MKPVTLETTKERNIPALLCKYSFKSKFNHILSNRHPNRINHLKLLLTQSKCVAKQKKVELL